MNWNWSKSFVVKDALNISRKAYDGDEFTSSFHPRLLKELCNVMLDCPERPEGNNFRVEEPERLCDSICLTSGGADSTIFWHYAGQPQGLYIDIGQPYAHKERHALELLGVNYQYIDLRGTRIGQMTWKHIIPGRNFLFLAVAAEMLNNDGNIWFAMTAGEGADSAKGDKSLLFVRIFENWYAAATGRYVHVKTAHLRTKVEWLQYAQKMGVLHDILIDTITCFSAEPGQCGRCQSCLRKYLSFVSIGMDTQKQFNTHPMIGASEYVEKYHANLKSALLKLDFSHYSKQRCIEDLQAIYDATKMLEEKA